MIGTRGLHRQEVKPGIRLKVLRPSKRRRHDRCPSKRKTLTRVSVVPTVEMISSVVDGPQPVVPEGKVAADASGRIEPAAAPIEQPAAPPESPQRVPERVANIPSAARAVPHDELQPAEAVVAPDATRSRSSVSPSESASAPRRADDSWREPAALLESLKDLTAAKPTSQWAAEVVRQIRALGPALTGGTAEAEDILGRLKELDRQAPELAKKVRETNKELAHKLGQAGFALGRRLDVWQEVVRLGAPQSAEAKPLAVDRERLALCLAEIDAATGDSAEGQAWRNYLLIDALKESSRLPSAAEDAVARQVAREALVRLTQTPLTSHQQKFVSSGPVAALRAELRRWAAEPVGAAAVLRDIEAYERMGLPSDARKLALDCQYLAMAPVEARRQLANSVDMHYRNANLRIAVTEELLNKLIPERNLEYAPVRETVLGRPVWGESLMASEVAVRMLPDPTRVLMALVVTGEIAAMTTADAGPARFHNDSESSYTAWKPHRNRHGCHPSVAGRGGGVQRDPAARRGDSLGRRSRARRVRQESGQIAVGAEQGGGYPRVEGEDRVPGARTSRHRGPRAFCRSRETRERTGVRSVEHLVARPPNDCGRNHRKTVHDAVAGSRAKISWAATRPGQKRLPTAWRACRSTNR